MPFFQPRNTWPWLILATLPVVLLATLSGLQEDEEKDIVELLSDIEALEFMKFDPSIKLLDQYMESSRTNASFCGEALQQEPFIRGERGYP